MAASSSDLRSSENYCTQLCSTSGSSDGACRGASAKHPDERFATLLSALSLSAAPRKSMQQGGGDAPHRDSCEEGEGVKLDLELLREFVFNGGCDSDASTDRSRIRPIAWRVLLGVLDERPAQWQELLAEKRRPFQDWKREFFGCRRQSVVGRQPCEVSSPSSNRSSSATRDTYDQDTALMKEIGKSALPFFAIGGIAQQWMLRILFVYAKLDPEIGYMQGMNEILAPIVFVYGSHESDAWTREAEADAFYSFSTIMKSVKLLYLRSPVDPSKSGVETQMTRLTQLLRQHDALLWQHLTVIMHDPVQGKDLEHILNDLLTERAYGHVVNDAASGEKVWVWNGRSVLVADDGEIATAIAGGEGGDQVSYGRFLRAQYPMSADPATAKHNKKQRKVLHQYFTKPGHAGEKLASEHDALLEKLRLPADVEDAHAGRQVSRLSDSQHFFILPAFYRFVQHLHARGTKFNLIFRTYGDDLKHIAQEFNCFCEGTHPYFPLDDGSEGSKRLLMDGSDGGVDRRIHLFPREAGSEEAHRFGTFFRSDELTALVMGTFEQPTADYESQDLSFYDASQTQKLQVVTGIPAIHDFLTRKWRAQQATLAIRDFYPFWFRNCEDPRAGKLMTLDPVDDAANDTHVVFFDDNILPHEPHIVDARDARDGSVLDFFAVTQDVHLLRVEPLNAIRDENFFIERFHASLERKRERQRLERALELA